MPCRHRLQSNTHTQHMTHDGMGHQLEGKLNFILLSAMFPDLFAYVHTVFSTFQHTKILGPSVEEFFGFYKVFPSKEHIRKYNDLKVGTCYFWGHDEDLAKWQTELESKGSEAVSCDRHCLHDFDGVFVTKFMPPGEAYENTVRNSSVFKALREAYYSTPKPKTGFRKSRKNVVVHMRRGDADWRKTKYEYVLNAMMAVNASFGLHQRRPLFFLESDEEYWTRLNDLEDVFGKDNIVRPLPENHENALLLFHKMVEADILITSQSSMSYAAAMYNTSPYKFVAWKRHKQHRDMFLNDERKWIIVDGDGD